MSLAQVTKKLGFGIGAIVLLLLLILTFANFESFDEKLSLEVAEALHSPEMPADQNNAFIAIWGLTAANEKDMISTGRTLIERYRSNWEVNRRDELTDKDYQEILANGGIDKIWQSKIGNCHVRKHQDCALKLANQIAQEPLDSPRLNIMMTRYRKILSLSDYQHMDHITFASPLPPFGPLLDLSKLSQAMALNSGDPQLFIKHLASELKFWRMLLNQGDTIMDKMIANVGYRNNLASTSNFLSTQASLSESQLQQLKQLLTPLSQSELDISEAFLFEEKAFFNTLQNIDAEQLKEAFGLSSSPVAWLIQPNATINDYHEFFVKKIQALGKLNTTQFAEAIKAKKGGSCCFQEIESLSSPSFSTLYNLGGKSLLTTSLFNGQDYLARIHDLNGMIGLVGLQLSMLSDQSTTAQWLSENDALLGHVIRFDQTSNTLEFDCLDTNSICKLNL